jgi:DNA-directed RNA polymerase subunit H
MVVVHNMKRLQYNVLKHQYVPPCSILNDEQVLEFKQKFNIQNSKQLPEISRFDPQALAICLRPGDIIKLMRRSETAGTFNYYRVCVN